MSGQDQKIMEVLINSNQKRTKQIMSSYLRKQYPNVIETKDYIIVEGTIPVCIVSHMDTVFEDSVTRYGRDLYYDEKHNVMFSPYGAGFDDKAGLFAIIQLVRSGLRPHIILTTDEERGALGASEISKLECPFDDIRYFIQLDRRGSNDCVFYDCDNKEFTEYVESFGFVQNYGTFSDISEICPSWGIAGVNLSVGYDNEHSESETLNVGQLLSTIKKVKRMLNDARNAPQFKFILNPISWYRWGRGVYAAYGSPEDTSVEKCHFCGKYFMEEEMFPIVLSDMSTATCCPNCVAEHVAWCNSCNNAYEKASPDAPSTGLCPICLETEEAVVNGSAKQD